MKKIKKQAISFHCQYCGATIDAKHNKCEFCGNALKSNHLSPYNILFYNDEAKYSLKNVVSIEHHFEYCDDCLTLRDEKGLLKRTEPTKIYMLIVEFPLTREAIQETLLLNGHNVKLEYEDISNNIAFQTTGYFAEIPNTLYLNTIVTINIKFIQSSNDFEISTPIIDMPCPNCGHHIHSRLGVCDYCKGWVEIGY